MHTFLNLSSSLALNEPASEKEKGLRTLRRITPSLLSRFSGLVSPWPSAYVREQHRFWRDCVEAQARLNLCCTRMLYVFFSRGATQMITELSYARLKH